MLALTRKSEYAWIAMCHLARVGERVVSARDIARAYAIPLPLLMNVLKTLQQAGLVDSERGARGGYRLGRPPAEISLAELVRAIDGPLRLVRCVTPMSAAEPACELLGNCPVRGPMVRVHEMFEEFLRGVSVADVAFGGGFSVDTRPAQPLKVLAQ